MAGTSCSGGNAATSGSLTALGIDDGASLGESTSALAKPDEEATLTLTTGAEVKAPKGAVASETKLGLERPDDKEAAQLIKTVDKDQKPASAPYVLTPHGTSFKEKVEVTLPIAKDRDARRLRVLYLEDEKDTSWEDLGAPQNKEGKATIQVDHFSVLMLVEMQSGAAAGGGADCQTSGRDCSAGELCDTALGACVSASQATCEEAADCATYEGAQVCIKSEGQCGEAECRASEDCGDSPTAECEAGACVDPTWGCLGIEDPREAPSASNMSTFKLKVLYFYPLGGANETAVKDLTWRVCQLGDLACNDDNRLVTTDVTYGDDGYLVVRGLEAGLSYRLQLQGYHPDPTEPGLPLLSTEYLMYRTVVGDTVEPRPILMFEDAVRTTMGSAGQVDVDKDLGLLLIRVFGCEDSEVGGVQVSTGTTAVGCGGGCPTTALYQDASNLPDPSATATRSVGRAAIFNLKPDVVNRVTLVRAADNKKVTSFNVTPRANWVQYVHFWPWNYGTASD